MSLTGPLAQAAEWELYRLNPDVHDDCTTTSSRSAACRANDKCEGSDVSLVSVHTELMNLLVNLTYQ